MVARLSEALAILHTGAIHPGAAMAFASSPAAPVLTPSSHFWLGTWRQISRPRTVN